MEWHTEPGEPRIDPRTSTSSKKDQNNDKKPLSNGGEEEKSQGSETAPPEKDGSRNSDESDPAKPPKMSRYQQMLKDRLDEERKKQEGDHNPKFTSKHIDQIRDTKGWKNMISAWSATFPRFLWEGAKKNTCRFLFTERAEQDGGWTPLEVLFEEDKQREHAEWIKSSDLVKSDMKDIFVEMWANFGIAEMKRFKDDVAETLRSQRMEVRKTSDSEASKKKPAKTATNQKGKEKDDEEIQQKKREAIRSEVTRPNRDEALAKKIKEAMKELGVDAKLISIDVPEPKNIYASTRSPATTKKRTTAILRVIPRKDTLGKIVKPTLSQVQRAAATDKGVIGQLIDDGMMMKRPVLHKGQECIVIDVEGLPEAEKHQRRSLEIDGIEYDAGLISDTSTMVEFNAHENLTEKEVAEIISKVANPKSDPAIQIDVKRTRILGTDEASMRCIAWINSAHIPKAWILREAAQALEQRRDAVVLAPSRSRCDCCGQRHLTKECSLSKEEGKPIKDIMDERDELRRKAWEERGKKRHQILQEAKKKAAEDNKDLNLKYRSRKDREKRREEEEKKADDPGRKERSNANQILEKIPEASPEPVVGEKREETENSPQRSKSPGSQSSTSPGDKLAAEEQQSPKKSRTGNAKSSGSEAASGPPRPNLDHETPMTYARAASPEHKPTGSGKAGARNQPTPIHPLAKGSETKKPPAISSSTKGNTIPQASSSSNRGATAK